MSFLNDCSAKEGISALMGLKLVGCSQFFVIGKT